MEVLRRSTRWGRLRNPAAGLCAAAFDLARPFARENLMPARTATPGPGVRRSLQSHEGFCQGILQLRKSAFAFIF